MRTEKEIFLELQTRFVGKTILKVDPPEASEAIAKFTMTDGSVFRLHATDLGYWFEDTVDNNKYYNSLTNLMQDYYHHMYPHQKKYDYDPPVPEIINKDHIVSFFSPEKKLFMIKTSSLTSHELKIINNSQGLIVLAQASEQGELWTMYFYSNFGGACPPELHFDNEKDIL